LGLKMVHLFIELILGPQVPTLLDCEKSVVNSV